MAARKEMSVENREIWDDDIIYSESFCEVEDIFYEGSEDEGYESPSHRRRRYEEAGQRFLAGNIPTLLSASLKGPFDKISGWANPWISRRNKSPSKHDTETSQVRNSTISQSKNLTQILPGKETTLQPRATDCHLPSPESLKQAPYAKSHTYLEVDEVEKVNQWREQIDRQPAQQYDFWASNKSDASTPVKKRRASGSGWLKKDSVKRRRSSPNQSMNQVRDDDVDELMADTPPSSFENTRPVSSPSKRRSPRNHMWSAKGTKGIESDDELSPSKAAAATLSSPVSLRNVPHASSCREVKPLRNYITSSAATQTTPSRLRYANHCVESSLTRLEHYEEKHVRNNASFTVNEAVTDRLVSTRQISEADRAEAYISAANLEDDKSAMAVIRTNSGNSVNKSHDNVASRTEGAEISNLRADVEPVSPINSIISNQALVLHESGADTKVGGMTDAKPEPTEQGSIQSRTELLATGSDNGNSPDVSSAKFDVQVKVEAENPTTPTSTISSKHSPGKESTEFSFKSIFNRFVPSSPWARLSQLTAGSPSATPKTIEIQGSSVSNQADKTEVAVKSEFFDAPLTETGALTVPVATNPMHTAEDRDQELIQSHMRTNIADMQSAPETTKTVNEAAGVTSKSLSEALEAPDKAVAISQQSPWTESDHAILPRKALDSLSPNLIKTKMTPRSENLTEIALKTEAQSESPRAPNTEACDGASRSSSSIDHNVDWERLVKPSITRQRPGTPEPQFYFKPFASFMSPSPDRSRRSHILPSGHRALNRNSHGSHPSVLRTRWSKKRPDLHVSWAASLVNFESSSVSRDEGTVTSDVTNPLKRQGSPPPETPISDLPKTDNKFSKHFAAIANRRDEHREDPVPINSQQKGLSPGPLTMAETLLVADTVAHTDDEAAQPRDKADNEASTCLTCDRASEEPMDIVEDMVREMGGFWDTWNIDAELDHAKRAGATTKSMRAQNS
ncbi:hypothetical protein QQS21_012386 [Conoideocrella luteorostrata]|uniref:Protamine P1 n=1 Tax=Conoideocrella luteorostrata TaxID=1105319 RepID=A0AAJ0FSR1_9HYPO|nr:hypothetical protein QQS21_012386 [Conoideocrella luteorostrata]